MEGNNRFGVTTYTVILNCLRNGLKDKWAAYFIFNLCFSFLSKEIQLNAEKIIEFVNNFQNYHVEDLEDNFHNECIYLQVHLKNKGNMSTLCVSDLKNMDYTKCIQT